MDAAPMVLCSPQPWSILHQAPALDDVFSRYMDPVYRFLDGRVGNREDLTSGVFVRAAHRLDTAHSDASIAAWVFAVARTVLKDHGR